LVRKREGQVEKYIQGLTLGFLELENNEPHLLLVVGTFELN